MGLNSLKKLSITMITMIAMRLIIQAENPIDKKVFIHFPNNFYSEVRNIGVKKNFEYSNNFTIESAPIIKKTIKAAFNKSKSIKTYDKFNTTGSLSSLILDFSVASYQDRAFVGPYCRIGIRYSDLDSKSHKSIDNDTIPIEDRFQESNATYKIYMPYALVGHNFDLINIATVGMGLGAGYAVVNSNGDPTSHSVIKGFQLVSELSIGILF